MDVTENEADRRACPMMSYQFVCGADNVTYDNECVMARANVELKAQGACVGYPVPTSAGTCVKNGGMCVSTQGDVCVHSGGCVCLLRGMCVSTQGDVCEKGDVCVKGGNVCENGVGVGCG